MKPFLFLFIVSCHALLPIEVTIPYDKNSDFFSVWVEKGEKISFAVKGNWTMWDKWKPVDYKGHQNFAKKVNGFEVGRLLARIEGADAFAVNDQGSHVAQKSGRIILYANRGNYAHLSGHGELSVEITGAREISQQEAEKKHGWDIAALDTARNESYLTEQEKNIILYLNKARSNPALFASLYLYHRRNEGAYAREAYNELLKKSPLPVIRPARPLFLAARDHAMDMGKAGKTGHYGTDNSSPETRVKRYGIFTGRYRGPWENCSYGFQDALEIVLQLIIDDGVASRGHRKNIFEKNVNFAGVATRTHSSYRYNSVHDFANAIEEIK